MHEGRSERAEELGVSPMAERGRGRRGAGPGSGLGSTEHYCQHQQEVGLGEEGCLKNHKKKKRLAASVNQC